MSTTLVSRAPHCEPQLSNSTITPLRAHRERSAQLPQGGPHVAVAAAPTIPPHWVAARPFANQAIQLLLAVLDRRASTAQLSRVMARELIAGLQIVTATGGPGAHLGPARMQRVHVQPSSATRAEFFATYRRGQRCFAVAGQLELLDPDAQQPHPWQIAALQIA